MKKMNKKGFTLIELLAVIIILGVLMIIAIPSVTTYIQNSRKSAYVDTADAYIAAVRTKVNEGKDLKLFNPDVLYMIPVNQDAAKSCVSVESGGQSPYNDTWNYAYVGVKYHQTAGSDPGYTYYFIGEDASGQGIYFMSQKAMSDSGTDAVYSTRASGTEKGNISQAAHDALLSAYGNGGTSYTAPTALVKYEKVTSGSQPTGTTAMPSGWDKVFGDDYKNIIWVAAPGSNCKVS